MIFVQFKILRFRDENMSHKNGKNRKDIKAGSEVYIVLKKDQRSGKRTKGIVKDLLTRSSFHPHGIKVRLEDGRIGRVQEIIK
jgi:uncharacterized repeat protein (TIGR03833 family)